MSPATLGSSRFYVTTRASRKEMIPDTSAMKKLFLSIMKRAKAKTKKKIVLSSEQRNTLLAYLSSGSKNVRLSRRAQIVLALDTLNNRIPLHAEQIGTTCQVSRQTIQVIKDAFLHSPSLDSILQRKKRATPPITPKVTGDIEAHILALCCSNPPEGYARWAVRLLADKCVELGIIASISPMTINRTLKKTNVSLT